MIRTAWIYVCASALTVVYGVPIVLNSLLGSHRVHDLCDRLPRAWARAILRLSGVTVHVEGLENLPPDRPQVVVSNHQSWFDVFALVAELPVRYRFVAKQELARIPIFGRAWRSCGHVSIDRSDRTSAVQSLNEAGSQVRERSLTIVMFPEGTRSWTGELQDFKKGAFVLAIQAGVPVVPVAILGSRAVMPKGRWRIRRGEIRVRIGEAIPIEGMVHRDRDRLVRRAWHAVAELKGEAVAAVDGSGTTNDHEREEGRVDDR